ncbi:reverse transcriptase domain-containing protein [Tanacetum coccineum]|uniref:Reverse transcriptase domain-containing protein n=1 Tax=Tanacetum coccineum TaxID=301880 RepID=A0ABQ5EIH8_9ASTR
MNSTKASSSNPSKKIKLTIIPPRQLFVNISSDEDVTTTPSPTTTSSSPTPPNAPSKNLSTNQTSSSSNEPTSLQLLSPLLDNILDVPPRPSNPQPLQSHPSLDITLSLSPITPLDHIHDTPSPPSPPQPQPPIMGHPLYYNYHEYHGSTYIYTKNEAVRLMMLPLSLTGEAKTWLDELNEGTIETWDELRTAFISWFFLPDLFDRLRGEIRAFSQHENESLTDAWLHMKEMLRNCHVQQPTPDLEDDDIPMSREEEAKFMQSFYKTRFTMMYQRQRNSES